MSTDAAHLEALASALEQVHKMLAKAAGLLAREHRPPTPPATDGPASQLHVALCGLADQVRDLKWTALEACADLDGHPEGPRYTAETIDQLLEHWDRL